MFFFNRLAVFSKLQQVYNISKQKKCSDAVFWENYNIGSQNHAKITVYNKITTKLQQVYNMHRDSVCIHCKK